MNSPILHTSKLALLSLLMAFALVAALMFVIGKQVVTWMIMKLYRFFIQHQ